MECMERRKVYEEELSVLRDEEDKLRKELDVSQRIRAFKISVSPQLNCDAFVRCLI